MTDIVQCSCGTTPDLLEVLSGGWRVFCPNCGRRGLALSGIEDAIKSWNPTPITTSEIDSDYSNPFSHQVGGSHYKGYEIEPFEFFFKNKIPHHKATVIRRILRYDQPSGHGKKDLDKIRHELDLIESLESFEDEKLESESAKVDLMCVSCEQVTHPGQLLYTDEKNDLICPKCMNYMSGIEREP